MNTSRSSVFPITLLFLIAAIYDGALGLVFLVAPASLFDAFHVSPPNHFGYVQFPALLLMIFALMFLEVAVNPMANRRLIPYGMMLKGAYSGLTFFYWLREGVPLIWKPFALIDAVMLVLFYLAFQSLGLRASPERPRFELGRWRRIGRETTTDEV